MTENRDIMDSFFTSYKDGIGEMLVRGPFGTSYEKQDGWTMVKPYNPDAARFVLEKTRVLLMAHLPTKYLHNLNFSYSFCQKISDFLADYLVKQPGGLSKEQVKDNVMNCIFYTLPGLQKPLRWARRRNLFVPLQCDPASGRVVARPYPTSSYQCIENAIGHCK